MVKNMKQFKKKKRPPPYTLQETELIAMEVPQDTIELTLWSSHVKGEPPAKLLILGEPEGGKTAIMQKYRNNKGVIVRRRFTAYGIIRELIKKEISLLYKNPNLLGHLMIYDFVNILTFKVNTVQSTIEFLSALLEEGLSPESAYWIAAEDLTPHIGLKAGLIAGINTYGFFTETGKVKKQLHVGGWLSRTTPLSFSTPELINLKISESISRSDYRYDHKFVDSIQLHFPKERVEVKLPQTFSLEIKSIASKVTQEINDTLGPYKLKGYRLQKSLIALVKASALRDGRKVVSKRDAERIRYLSQWFNLKMNPLKIDYPFK